MYKELYSKTERQIYSHWISEMYRDTSLVKIRNKWYKQNICLFEDAMSK